MITYNEFKALMLDMDDINDAKNFHFTASEVQDKLKWSSIINI